jgi:hypothetical protein
MTSTTRRSIPRAANLARPLARRARLQLQSLEVRALPAIITVNATNDEATDTDGKLSLGEALVLANSTPAADDVVFDTAVFVGLTTITLDASLGALPVTAAVTITGPGTAGTANLVTVSGNDATRLIDVSGAGVGAGFKYLTLIDGLTNSGGGGAIRIRDGASASLTQCDMRNNIASGGDGGAILVSGTGSLYLQLVNFSQNEATGVGAQGGGIAITSSGDFQAVDVTFSSNTASSGSALSIRQASAVNLSFCTLTNNKALAVNGRGGAVYVSGTASTPVSFRAFNCTFSGNRAEAGDGGGIFAEFLAGDGLSNCTIANNFAKGDGGGLCLAGGLLVVTGNTQISNNEADSDGGGAFVLTGALNLNGTVVRYNKAAQNGGGVCVLSGSLTATGSDFSYHGVVDSQQYSVEPVRGGGIYSQGTTTLTGCNVSINAASFGAGLEVATAGGSLTMVNSTVSGNLALYHPRPLGGGILLLNISTNAASKSLIRNTDILDNDVQAFPDPGGPSLEGNGGGIAAVGSGNLDIDQGSTVSGCYADFAGGGIHIAGDGGVSPTVAINDSTINLNRSQNGGGIAIRDASSAVTISSSLIKANQYLLANNNPEAKGGGVYVTGNPSTAGSVSFIDVDIEGNRSNNGGGVYIDAANAPVSFSEDCRIIDNSTEFSKNLGWGGGLLVTGVTSPAGQVSFDGGIISENRAGATPAGGFGVGRGGGVMVFDTNAAIAFTGVTIAKNSAPEFGGGVAVTDVKGAPTPGSVSFMMCDIGDKNGNPINGNTTVDGAVRAGGGLDMRNTSLAVTLDMCNVAGNTSFGGVGGGISASQAPNLTVRNLSLISNNSASEGGGVNFESAAGATLLADCIITGNIAVNKGGGVRLVDVSTTTPTVIRDCTISNNEVMQLSGGGLSFEGDGKPELRACSITGNKSNFAGGGLYVYGGKTASAGANAKPLVYACTFDSNAVVGSNPAGGGIAMEHFPVGDPVLTIQNTTITNNSAVGDPMSPSDDGRGGGISIARFSVSKFSDEQFVGDLEVYNSTICKNVAFNSGGIHIGDFQYELLPAKYLGAVSLISTIVSQNTVLNTSAPRPDVGGPLTQELASFIGGDPRFDTFDFHGGTTKNWSLKLDSPVIDIGLNPEGLEHDQRGIPYFREAGIPGKAVLPDIGAFELQGPRVSSVKTYLDFGPPTKLPVERSHSHVRDIVITFTEAVTFAGSPVSAFVLTNTATGKLVDLTATLFESGRRVVLTFSGSETESVGSLKDGLYQVSIASSKVSANLVALDGDGNALAGDDYLSPTVGTDNVVWRLFGDVTSDGGDRDVDAEDFAAFRLAFGTPNAQFDFDGDGDVDAADFAQFRARFGLSV